MSSNTFNMESLTVGIDDADSKSYEDMQDDDNTNSQSQRSGTHVSRASAVNTNTSKRSKDISPCYVCGAKAHGYNFDQSKKTEGLNWNIPVQKKKFLYSFLVTCESCKAFFRRNALKSMVFIQINFELSFFY